MKEKKYYMDRFLSRIMLQNLKNFQIFFCIQSKYIRKKVLRKIVAWYRRGTSKEKSGAVKYKRSFVCYGIKFKSLSLIKFPSFRTRRVEFKNRWKAKQWLQIYRAFPRLFPWTGNKLLLRRFPSAVRSSIYQRLIREFVRWRRKKGEVRGTIRRFSALVNGASEGNCPRERNADLKCRFEF